LCCWRRQRRRCWGGWLAEWRLDGIHKRIAHSYAILRLLLLIVHQLRASCAWGVASLCGAGIALRWCCSGLCGAFCGLPGGESFLLALLLLALLILEPRSNATGRSSSEEPARCIGLR
jgi:hypothetical protein